VTHNPLREDQLTQTRTLVFDVRSHTSAQRSEVVGPESVGLPFTPGGQWLTCGIPHDPGLSPVTRPTDPVDEMTAITEGGVPVTDVSTGPRLLDLLPSLRGTYGRRSRPDMNPAVHSPRD
jgi:hypothetical protein